MLSGNPALPYLMIISGPLKPDRSKTELRVLIGIVGQNLSYFETLMVKNGSQYRVP